MNGSCAEEEQTEKLEGGQTLKIDAKKLQQKREKIRVFIMFFV